MSPETASFESGYSEERFNNFFERIADIYVRLKVQPEARGIAWRQEIPDNSLEPLLNGRHGLIKARKFGEPRTFLYAGANENRAWLRVSHGKMAIKVTITEGEELPKCDLQEKLREKWETTESLGEISWSELETIIKYGEKITGLLGSSGSSQINRLPGPVVGNESL